MKLRNSLINMLGEFVGLHKTPDFKLNAQSSQAIVEAVAAESRRYSISMNYSASSPSSYNTEYVTHQRSLSTNSTSELRDDNGVINMDPSYRRLSEPTSLPSFTPPRQRHIDQRLLINSQKKRSRKQGILSNFFGRNDKNISNANDANNQQQKQQHNRRDSQTSTRF